MQLEYTDQDNVIADVNGPKGSKKSFHLRNHII